MADLTPTLLALDTATETMALGLVAPSGQWTRHLPGGAESSAHLLPAVQQLLVEAGLRLSAVDAVAFGRGPGAFTGLRTACAVAQGLALGVGKPVLPLDSLLVLAEDARNTAQAKGSQSQAQTWWVAVDARMDEVYAAEYAWAGAAGWQVATAPALYTLPALGDLWAERAPIQVAGNAHSVFAQRLPWGTAQVHDPATDRAAALLRLALDAWRAGAAVDAAEALPIYLRDKVAQTTAERAAARAAAAVPAASASASTLA